MEVKEEIGWGIGLKQCEVIRNSMTSLCLTAAPDCRTGQRKVRYCVCLASFPVVVCDIKRVYVFLRNRKKWQDVEDKKF